MKSHFFANWNTQTKKGLLTLLIMNIASKKKCYGYEIIQIIKNETGLIVAEGTIYPLLKNLIKEKLIASKWDINNSRGPRKYYYMTGNGNLMLNEMNKYWQSLNHSILEVINNMR
jgi:PadR family transcriptional regulator PadR